MSGSVNNNAAAAAAARRAAIERAQEAQREAQRRAAALQAKARAAQKAAQKQKRPDRDTFEKANRLKNQARDAQAKARDAKDAVTAAKKSKNAAFAQSQAVRSEKDANSVNRDAGKKVKYSAADHVKDAYDRAKLSSADQEKLFGAKSVVTPQQAAQHDSQQIQQLAHKDPAKAAALLRHDAQSSQNPDYRASLVTQSAPAAHTIAQKLSAQTPSDGGKQILGDLAQAAELGGPHASKALANGFTSGITPNPQAPDAPLGFEGAFKDVVSSGKGASFAVNVAGGLNRRGLTSSAKEVSGSVKDGMEGLQKNYEKQAAIYEDSEQRMNARANLLGLKGQERADFEQAWRDRFPIQQNLDSAAKKFETTLQGASAAVQDPDVPKDLRETSAKSMEEVPSLQFSASGRKFLAGQVDQQAHGQGSIFDGGPAAAQLISDKDGAEKANEFRAGFGSVYTQSVGSRLIQLQTSGDKAGARQLLDGTARNLSALDGLPPDKTPAISQSLQDLASGKKGARAEFEHTLLDASKHSSLGPQGGEIAKGTLAQLGYISDVSSKAGHLSPEEEKKSLFDTAKEYEGQFSLAHGILENTLGKSAAGAKIFDSNPAKGFSKFLSGVDLFLGATDVYSGTKSLLNGNPAGVFQLGTGLAGLAGAGGLFSAGLEGVAGPAGLIVAAGAFLGGKIYEHRQHDAFEKEYRELDSDQLRAGLTALGISPALANKLSVVTGDAGHHQTLLPKIQKLAEARHESPAQYLQDLSVKESLYDQRVGQPGAYANLLQRKLEGLPADGNYKVYANDIDRDLAPPAPPPPPAKAPPNPLPAPTLQHPSPRIFPNRT